MMKHLQPLRSISAVLAALCLLIISSGTLADSAVLSWTNPTKGLACSTEGPLLTELGGVRLYVLVADVPAPAESYTVLNLPAGEYEFIATAYVEGADGLEESWHFSKATKVSTGLKVIEDKAYTQSLSPSGVVLNVYGSIPLGTACDEANSVKGFGKQELLHGVPVDLVQSAGGSPVYAFAKCG